LESKVRDEEELIHHTLQERLNQVANMYTFLTSQLQSEKVKIESLLEQEQEYITNKLVKQLDAVQADKKCAPKASHSHPKAIGATPC
jgi:hypothetical protein